MAGPLVVPPPPPPGGPQPTQKTSEIIGNLRPTKLFKLPSTSVTSLDFDDSGEFILAACADESLQLYNAKEGKSIKQLFSKKYGAHLARFTHHSQSIIYASTKGDDTIRYLSTHDNQFLRYFKGHTAPVTTLAVCPASDSFLSCSLDDTVRLWSLNSPNPQGRLNLSTPTLAAYDPSATVIAVASPSTSSILLYDLRNYDKPPFATFDLRRLDSYPHVLKTVAQSAHLTNGTSGGASSNNHGGITSPISRSWTKLEFSNDGKSVLLGTNASSGHLLLDAFSGEIRAFLTRSPQYLPLNPMNLRAAPYPPNPIPQTAPSQGDVCFSADGRFVIGSSGGDHDAVVWDTQSQVGDEKVLGPMAALPCDGKVGVVGWNPRYNMLATADREVVFWVPDEFVGRKAP
ncbi:MAG: member of Set1p complex, histone methyl transferase [Icmadophila ericetorum]|nr:member of Set1p complex, histone methyl transferase [Icmadophila ericetorum]